MIARMNKSYVPTFWDEIFNDQSFNSFLNERSHTTPAVNVIEENNEYRIDVAAPGLGKKDFKIDLADNLLTISSEKKVEMDESKNKFMRREFSYDTFKRSFQLPKSVEQDKIAATHKEGILTIHLPKKEEELKKGPKTIAIA